MIFQGLGCSTQSVHIAWIWVPELQDFSEYKEVSPDSVRIDISEHKNNLCVCYQNCCTSHGLYFEHTSREQPYKPHGACKCESSL